MGVQTTFACQIGNATNVTIVHELFGLVAIRIAGEHVSFGAIRQIDCDAKHMPFHLLFHLFIVVMIIRNSEIEWSKIHMQILSRVQS